MAWHRWHLATEKKIINNCPVHDQPKSFILLLFLWISIFSVDLYLPAFWKANFITFCLNFNLKGLNLPDLKNKCSLHFNMQHFCWQWKVVIFRLALHPLFFPFSLLQNETWRKLELQICLTFHLFVKVQSNQKEHKAQFFHEGIRGKCNSFIVLTFQN